MLNTSLDENFYNADGWFNSLVNYYGEERRYLPKDVLEEPMHLLTSVIESVCVIGRHWPESTHNLLKQAVDPLFESGEYVEKVYNFLLSDSKERQEPLLEDIAESLLVIRRMFERDKEFLVEEFADSIDKVKDAEGDQKLALFAQKLHSIVKIHTMQIVRMIASRK